MAISGKIDKLVRGFLQSGDPRRDDAKSVDQLVFNDIQDPTFLTFKLSFFPDAGYSFPDDEYSAGGLFRKSKFSANNTSGVPFEFMNDSAVDYLKAIGAPAKHAYLEAFITMLSRIESDAPWYFQSISGLGDLWKIDPAQNFRGKDKVLTIDCLESVDLRMTMLADLYNNVAFEAEYMREILPYNLRTFNMEIHVLEVRRFNNTFGKIADFYGKNRNVKGQDNQENLIDSRRNSPYDEPSLATGGGGLLLQARLPMLAQQQASLNEANSSSMQQLRAAFEPISVITFKLKNCEFDFMSESPQFLETVSTKETPEAATRFKIKVGKIEKSTNYSFYDHVISDVSSHSKVNPDRINPLAGRIAGFDRNLSHYLENTDLGVQGSDAAFSYNQAKSNSIFPAEGSPSTAQVDAYDAKQKELKNLRNQGKFLDDPKSLPSISSKNNLSNNRLERALTQNIKNKVDNALNSVRQEVSDSISNAKNELNNVLGNATNGLLGRPNLGNTHGKSPGQNLRESLNSFTSNGEKGTSKILKNINFEALKILSTITSKNIGLE